MPLPVPLTDEDRHRLLLVKEIYRAALGEVRAPLRSYRRIIAVISLDLACESLAQAVVWTLGAGAQAKGEFRELVPQARVLIAKASGVDKEQRLPGEGGVWRLHNIRGDAQHRTVPPSDETLNDCRTYARDFLVGIMGRVWDTDLDALAASDAIVNERCRTMVAEGEAAIGAADYLLAARKARQAYDWAKYMAKNARFGRRRGLGPLSAYQGSDMYGSAPLSSFSRDVERELADIRDTLTEVALGIDYTQHARLARFTGHRMASLRSENWSEPREEFDGAAAEWAVAYCTDAILRLEAAHGPLTEEIRLAGR